MTKPDSFFWHDIATRSPPRDVLLEELADQISDIAVRFEKIRKSHEEALKILDRMQKALA